MAKLHELPQQAQAVMTSIGSASKTVYQLVDALGWSQTTVQKWVDALEKSGWIDGKVIPDSSPAGGSAMSYSRKAGV